MKSKPDVQRSRWRGWLGVALASASLGSQVSPGLALAAGNKTKAGVSAKPKAEASAKPKAEASAKPKAEASAKPKAEASAKPKVDASAKPKPDASTKPGSDVSAQPATPVPAKAKGKPGPNPPQISPLVEACVDHHTDAQELRMAGKLVESRDALRQCAAEACPALLQRDCVGWLEQVEKQLPSISFRITVDGQSRSDVRVFVDGVRAREPESGRAVDLDPGAHELRVEYPGAAPFSERIVLSEGERYRLVEVSLTLPPQPPPKPEMHRPVPIMTYVLGSLGIAGAVSGGIWGASSLSLRQELEDSCAPACPERRVNELRQRALYTDVSLGIAAVSLLGATTLFVFRPEVPVEVDVSWLPDGGGLGNVRIRAF